MTHLLVIEVCAGGETQDEWLENIQKIIEPFKGLEIREGTGRYNEKDKQGSFTYRFVLPSKVHRACAYPESGC